MRPTDARRSARVRGPQPSVRAVSGADIPSALLFEISPTDAATLGGVVVLVLGIAMLASAVPARSSARIDPAIALRGE